MADTAPKGAEINSWSFLGADGMATYRFIMLDRKYSFFSKTYILLDFLSKFRLFTPSNTAHLEPGLRVYIFYQIVCTISKSFVMVHAILTKFNK